MRTEIILYIYMASCLSVLLYNLIYIGWDKYQEQIIKRRRLLYLDDIMEQMQRIEAGNTVSGDHAEKLQKQLKNVEKLRAFYDSMEHVKKEVADETVKTYMAEMRQAFLELVSIYRKRDLVERAYLAYIIENFAIDRGQSETDGIIMFLLEQIPVKDVHLRENVLRALYSIGNEEAIMSAWRIMESENIHHSRQLLADGLLSFQGDREELARKLVIFRRDFSITMFLPVMQFIRRCSDGFQKEFAEILVEDSEEKELRLEAIRYFRRYPYEPVKELLMNFLRYQEHLDWEYGAMAALALSSYQGDMVVFCLKEGLRSNNWYIRYNCAQSLIYGLGLGQLQLFDIYNGKDRYAREIINYVLEEKGLEHLEMEMGR